MHILKQHSKKKAGVDKNSVSHTVSESNIVMKMLFHPTHGSVFKVIIIIIGIIIIIIISIIIIIINIIRVTKHVGSL